MTSPTWGMDMSPGERDRLDGLLRKVVEMRNETVFVLQGLVDFIKDHAGNENDMAMIEKRLQETRLT